MLLRSLPNNTGVFQGSALRPLLFTVCSHNLSLYAGEAAVFQYADGTQVFVSGQTRDLRSLISRMEGSLASFSDWFCVHGLKLNVVGVLAC